MLQSLYIHHFSLVQVYLKDKFPEVGYLDAFTILIDFAEMLFWGLIPIYTDMCESTLWERVWEYCLLTEMPTEYTTKLLEFLLEW